ncbi:MAG: UDP-N-acetylmuramate--L-alanine ligase [Syntrophomonadaceae bacterium]|nr:UDP-N-acetylmuramate--L-alanine ligase [Syntrophomonadaceae bacterium]
MTANSIKWIHMVGIAGAGMSGIAKVLLEQGIKVSGSDLQFSSTVQNLQQAGVIAYRGHSAANMDVGIDLAVYSSAVPWDNEEIQWAVKNNIPVLKRGEMLARLVNDKNTVAVAGAHGKTTTSAMVYTVLEECGVEPSFIVGGELQGTNINARLGNGDYFVVEADESDASFLELKPNIAVITNIEDDHLDYYKSVDKIKAAFLQFVNQVNRDGFALLFSGDENNCYIKENTDGRVILYGEDAGCDYCLKNWLSTGTGSQFDVYKQDKIIGQAEISVPGKHNAYNALAAIAVAWEKQLPWERIQAGIRKYRGAKRRFQVIGSSEKVLIVDDYAHHPTEIMATIEAARHYHPAGRIVVVFQPHRYSRTKLLGRQLGEAFKQADEVIITGIYSAGEKPLEGITGEIVFNAARDKGYQALYIPALDEIESYLLKNMQADDLIITMGAGDIWKLGPELLSKINH